MKAPRSVRSLFEGVHRVFKRTLLRWNTLHFRIPLHDFIERSPTHALNHRRSPGGPGKVFFGERNSFFETHTLPIFLRRRGKRWLGYSLFPIAPCASSPLSVFRGVFSCG